MLNPKQSPFNGVVWVIDFKAETNTDKMREQINGYFEQIKNFEPFDWVIVILLVIASVCGRA